MLRCYRLSCCLLGAILLGSCGTAPVTPPAAARHDEALQPEYLKLVADVTGMNRDAEAAYQSGKADAAAKIMTDEKPMVAKLLAVPQPSLAAMEAASDLDQLYGTMLLKNRHYGWARIMFQGNLSRWKHWRPATAESERRWKLAEQGIAECDRHMGEE